MVSVEGPMGALEEKKKALILLSVEALKRVACCVYGSQSAHTVQI